MEARVSECEPLQSLNEVGEDEDRLEARERRIAEIEHESGTRIFFTYDESSGDFGITQQGLIGDSIPLLAGEYPSFLAAYLSVTPATVAVPEILMTQHAGGADVSEQIRDRSVVPITSPIRLQLETGELQQSPRLKEGQIGQVQRCTDEFFSWFDWHDHATAGMAPTSFYSSNFGGKMRYADSYVANCTPVGSASSLWARHRIYYKNVFGNYIKHFEGKVPPGWWQAETKGSVRRRRRVSYDDGWGSDPSCSTCRYTREGRFSDS